MKLLNGEIFNTKEPLQTLMAQKLPVKVSYGLAKMANKLNEQIKVIDEVRIGLIKRYGEADKDNPQQLVVKTDSENYPKFVEEMTELMSQEVEVVIDKVKLPEQVDDKPFEIEASVLMALEKFVEV